MSDTANTYEGLFLFPQSAASTLKEASEHIMSLLERAGAEVISFAKWDERRLAYEIAGNKRGIYFLTYFTAEPDQIAGLERNCNLSEDVLRFMFVRAENIPAEVVQEADGREKLADEIKVRGEKDEKTRAAGARDGRSRVVDAATRAEEERLAAEGPKSDDAPAKDGEASAEADTGGDDAEVKKDAAPSAAADTDGDSAEVKKDAAPAEAAGTDGDSAEVKKDAAPAEAGAAE